MEDITVPGHAFFLRGPKFGYLAYLLVAIALWTLPILADTLPKEAAALTGLASNWQNTPQNWKGLDPCGTGWVGITCSNSHITAIVLSAVGIKGILSGEIQQLVELVHLDLSFNRGLEGPIPNAIGTLMKLRRLILVGCSFSGNVPPELGNLPRLEFLSLNSNKLSGSIPGALGNLSSLVWFDMTDNQLSGSIPISNGTDFGLDMLTSCKHFHFGKNNLSGAVPPKLFHSEMKMIHFLFDHNQLTGTIPGTLGLVTSLEALRLDGNSLTGPVPSNINNLTDIIEMHLSNNRLTGPLPNLTGMNAITYLDMSNNSFDESDVPSWFSTLPSLTTLILENLKVAGQIPQSLFDFPPLQTARLRFNRFNGTLVIGTTFSSELTLVDLQYNDIDNLTTGGYKKDLILVGNPYCNQEGSEGKFCATTQESNKTIYSTPTLNCGGIVCPSDQERNPYCNCSYPYKGIIYFRFLTFSNIDNSSYYKTLEQKLYSTFDQYQSPVVAVSIQNPEMNGDSYLQMDLWFFPAGKSRFSKEDIVQVSNLFSNLTFKAPDGYGPYYFHGNPYPFPEEPGAKSKRTPLIVGLVIGLLGLGLSSIILMIYARRKREKAKKKKGISMTSGSWNPSGSASSIPQVKGPRLFSFEELNKCTDNFAEANDIGSGGYGKVYRGTLYDGQLVAVKRAERVSMQGDHEFRTEIEMLSRVHHKNLVNLVGFCMDQDEQILVYEYVPNGSLRESLSGKSGVKLDWKKRLWVALGAARGLTYLHDLADPPIIHRDIKSNNILLDHNLNAKVSDFGLSKSKPIGGDVKKGHITTQVKGTMGYMDPEYYMTQQLTEKSDVYSFGVVLLELVTARKPIERSRYIVREVKIAMKKTKDLYGLHDLLDPVIDTGTTLTGFKRFVDLALKCVDESSDMRPGMSEVTKEIESIILLAGMNPNAGSATTSASYSHGKDHPYDSHGSFDYSGGPYSSVVEAK